MQPVSVIVPTMRRPESLERALRSLFVQTAPMASIVVVDNDPAATARNAGLSTTDAPLIAFLDDDEAASPQWLAALRAALDQTKSDVVFGPIAGRVPADTGWAAPYLEAFFGRTGPDTTRRIDKPWGCGNSLMNRATALPGAAPFDASADQSGGEDDALFAALQARGGTFGWAADAWVDEFAPPHRATMAYALSRAFAYGQGPSQTAAKARNWPGVARWMIVGAVQALVWGIAAIGLTVIAHPSRARMMDRAARGLGKIFWMKGFEPHFYGARELARLNRVSPSAA